jgi:phosphoribosylglycinamide formyltransferase 1
MRNIVILISGGGSNMHTLLKTSRERDWAGRFDAGFAAVFSNKATAGGLAIAQGLGVATEVIDHKPFAQDRTPEEARQAFDAALADAIDAYQPALVLLAGFMRILTPGFVSRFEGRMLNIHPSLLPAFPGLHTHERAIAEGCRVAGATVHEVTAVLDSGPIWEQAAVPVLPHDTAETLSARVLSQEHLIYPRAVERWLAAHPA